jgi:hypothetical protein
VPDYPDVAQAWTKFMRCMIVALAGSLFFTGARSGDRRPAMGLGAGAAPVAA